MEILGKVISDKAAEAISEIEAKLKKPVIYSFTDTSKTLSFGQCDYTQPDAYYVYSKQSLFNITKANQVNIPFETNILHELLHLCQIEEGFPYTGTVNLAASDGIDLGSTFASVILDLNVDVRLKDLGYSSEYFYKNRLIHARKEAMKGRAYDSPVSFVSIAVSLIGEQILYPVKETDEVLLEYAKKNPGLINCVKTVSSGIRQIGYSDAEKTFRSLVYLFSAFELFSTHAITYRGKTYLNLDDVKADYSNIRTL